MKCPKCDKNTENLEPYDTFEEEMEDSNDFEQQTCLIEYFECPHCHHMWEEEDYV